jgi:uracil-DNA glycosylase
MEWKEFIDGERPQEYFKRLAKLINTDRLTHRVFPPKEDIFNALKLTPFNNIKVVIIGQDPYHEYGQAHGLAFSVKSGTKLPPSLQNIYKEIENEFGYKMSSSGDLSKWAKQGVLLLNTSLTVNEGMANSHKDYGWQIFTKKIVDLCNKELQGIIFLLWGRNAINIGKDIDLTKHYVLSSAHPSPLSAYNGFFGNNHFKKTNEILKSLGKEEIDWKI